MKSKKELCEITGISESTFNYWLGKKMIPEPIGIKKRRALWGDVVENIILKIRREQEAGRSLEQIRPRVKMMAEIAEIQAERAEIQAERAEIQAKRAHIDKWTDSDTARDRIFALSPIERHNARIGFFSGMNEGRGLAYATVGHGDKVSFLEIDWTVEGEEKVLRRIDISKLEYVQLVADRQESILKNDGILDIDTLGMIAFFPEFEKLIANARSRLEYNKYARDLVAQVAKIKTKSTS